MIDVITSFAPRATRIAPIARPTAPPASADASTQIGIASGHGVPAGSAAPTTEHASTPAVSCASPPMLNMPASRATATASPVKIRPVAL